MSSALTKKQTSEMVRTGEWPGPLYGMTVIKDSGVPKHTVTVKGRVYHVKIDVIR